MYYFPDYRRYIRIFSGLTFCILKAVHSCCRITLTSLVSGFDLPVVHEAKRPLFAEVRSRYQTAIYSSVIS